MKGIRTKVPTERTANLETIFYPRNVPTEQKIETSFSTYEMFRCKKSPISEKSKKKKFTTELN